MKKDQQSEVQQRQQLIAHLKDQLQECKAKTNMECKYEKKSSENAITVCQNNAIPERFFDQNQTKKNNCFFSKKMT